LDLRKVSALQRESSPDLAGVLAGQLRAKSHATKNKLAVGGPTLADRASALAVGGPLSLSEVQLSLSEVQLSLIELPRSLPKVGCPQIRVCIALSEDVGP
jgi:hypothetical protein